MCKQTNVKTNNPTSKHANMQKKDKIKKLQTYKQTNIQAKKHTNAHSNKRQISKGTNRQTCKKPHRTNKRKDKQMFK